MCMKYGNNTWLVSKQSHLYVSHLRHCSQNIRTTVKKSVSDGTSVMWGPCVTIEHDNLKWLFLTDKQTIKGTNT